MITSLYSVHEDSSSIELHHGSSKKKVVRFKPSVPERMKLLCFGGLPFQAHCKYPRLTVIVLLSLSLISFLILNYRPWSIHADGQRSKRVASRTRRRVSVVPVNWNKADLLSKTSCHFHTCFEINDCIFGLEDRIRVHVHDPYEFHSPITLESYAPDVSQEYAEVLDAIRSSEYHESNISQACVIVPPVDTLNQQQHDAQIISAVLNSLPK